MAHIIFSKINEEGKKKPLGEEVYVCVRIEGSDWERISPLAQKLVEREE